MENPDESRMQQTWAAVLKIPTDSIGRDDSFLRLGGDSISAIQLVSVAREAGFSLSVQDVFSDPRLSAITAKGMLKTPSQDEVYDAVPFGLVPAAEIESLKAAIARECGLDQSQIEDIYPSTSLQEGLMALAVKQRGSYIAKLAYRLSDAVDINRFQRAWEHTVNICSNLRTRIVLHNGQTFQAVIRESPAWEEMHGSGSLSAALDAAKRTEMAYGSRLCRYALVSDESSGQSYFLAILHHAVFDGWSMGLILETLRNAYSGGSLPVLEPYSRFINYTACLDQGQAADYWTTQLIGAQRAAFPQADSVRRTDTTAKPSTRVLETNITLPPLKDTSITKATVLRAAWALVLGRYCDTDDVTFGTAVSGRQAPVPGVARMPGLVVATVPARIQINRNKAVADFLRDVQTQASEMVAYEQYGLQNISKLSADAKDACDFASLLVVQPAKIVADITGGAELLHAETASEAQTAEQLLGYFNYPLILEAIPYDDRIELMLVYDSGVVSGSRLEAMTKHLGHVIQQLLVQPEAALSSSVSVAGSWDLDQAVRWNSSVNVDLVDSCIHDLISSRVSQQSAHEAVYAHDGTLTYRQLEELSDLLASNLTRLGAGPETLVPMCFEKSKWAIVAMLGILKAGAAFVPLDPSHPVARRRELISETKAHLIVTSAANAASCDGLVDVIVELSAASIASMSKSSSEYAQRHRVSVAPANAAYAIFTSGSTGKPKTIVVSHSALCTSISVEAPAFDIGPDSRVLQFSNFVFDVSLAEIFTTLGFGGTICIPSEEQRLQDIAGFINLGNVSNAYLTPSFAETFAPDATPTLKTLVLGGEAPTRNSLEKWFGRVRLINGYGPAEAVIYCASFTYSSPADLPSTIGRGLNGRCWVVDPLNHQVLAPIGCIGELLVVQGHALARGYAGDEELTALSFTDPLAWLPSSHVKDGDRFYKTGDLVRYNTDDGTLEYLGRKDTQVKLRGQRVELGAIEHEIKSAQTTKQVEHVAVDKIRYGSQELLAAFVKFSNSESDREGEATEILLPMTADLRTSFGAIIEHLKGQLPSYMVPYILVPLRDVPFQTSMKLHRSRLRELAASLTHEQLRDYSLVETGEIEEPVTEMEFNIRAVWAQVLGLPASHIGRNDSFLQIGGDSIGAIQLVTVAQEQGINLTVQDIFNNPRLAAVALAAANGHVTKSFATQPFSLLRHDKVDDILTTVTSECGINRPSIKDAYPCTALQEGLMALSVKEPGSYIARHVYRLSDVDDEQRFKAAWERTLAFCDNLRTRIVLHDGSSIQAVLQEQAAWEPTEDFHSLVAFLDAAKTMEMQYCSRLCRYAFISEPTGARYFVLLVHHAVFDGWGMGLVMETLCRFYGGDDAPAVELTPYAHFVNFASSIDFEAAEGYWKGQLAGAQRAAFPLAHNRSTKQASTQKASVTRVLKTKIDMDSRTGDASITKATFLRAAWGLLLARYCDTDDVTFGMTVSGRQAPLPGVEKVTGPAVATIPVRLKLDRTQTIADFLRDVQIQASQMVSYEQYGLQRISKLGPDAKEACDFAALMIIQPARVIGTFEASLGAGGLTAVDPEEYGSEVALDGSFNYPLVLQAIVHNQHVELVMTYNDTAISKDRLLALTHHLEHIVQQLLVHGDAPLNTLSTAGPWDLDQASKWNSIEPAVVDARVQDIIAQRTTETPSAEAVFSWDGTLTYSELDSLSSKLAASLAGIVL
ncbi:hypothetical protein BR93DRAFT_904372, partial [Coniochaeta sp. PMI_546]